MLRARDGSRTYALKELAHARDGGTALLLGSGGEVPQNGVMRFHDFCDGDVLFQVNEGSNSVVRRLDVADVVRIDGKENRLILFGLGVTVAKGNEFRHARGST
jgi:hypothetical protein